MAEEPGNESEDEQKSQGRYRRMGRGPGKYRRMSRGARKVSEEGQRNQESIGGWEEEPRKVSEDGRRSYGKVSEERR